MTLEAKTRCLVVFGAGADGMAEVEALKHADVESGNIDRSNRRLFRPLLYHVAMAGCRSSRI